MIHLFQEDFKPSFNVHLLCTRQTLFMRYPHRYTGSLRTVRLWLSGNGRGSFSYVCLGFSTLSLSEMGDKAGTLFSTAVTMSNPGSACVLQSWNLTSPGGSPSHHYSELLKKKSSLLLSIKI